MLVRICPVEKPVADIITGIIFLQGLYNGIRHEGTTVFSPLAVIYIDYLSGDVYVLAFKAYYLADPQAGGEYYHQKEAVFKICF